MSLARQVCTNPFAAAGHDILDPLETSARFTVHTYNVLYSPSPGIALVPDEKETTTTKK